MALVFSCQELPDLKELHKIKPDAKIVFFNLRLDTLRGDLGLPAFPPKASGRGRARGRIFYFFIRLEAKLAAWINGVRHACHASLVRRDHARGYPFACPCMECVRAKFCGTLVHVLRTGLLRACVFCAQPSHTRAFPFLIVT